MNLQKGERLRIAIIGTRGIPARYGGFESCVDEIGTRLADRGHEIAVYCRSEEPRNRPKNHGNVRLIHVQELNAGRVSNPYNSFIATMHAFLLRYDILHFFGGGNVPFCLLGRLLGRRVVLTVDGLEWNRMSYSWPTRLYLRALAELAAVFPNILVTDSKSCQEWYESRTKQSPIYIPYGTGSSRDVDEKTLAKYDLGMNRYFLFVGRLVFEKGAHTLIEAFESLDTDFELVIVGGAERTEYVDSLKSTTNARIRFLGYVYGEELSSIRNGAFAYVHPSLLDGTSISLLGALGAGLSVVSSDIRENMDVAGDAALYFEAGNPDDLREKLRRVLEDTSLVYRMREDSVQRAAALYDWMKVADQYERLYFALMKSTRDWIAD